MHNGRVVTAYYFSASWCGPCHQFKPVLLKVVFGYPNVCYREVDVDAHPNLADKYEIQSIPSVLLVDDRENEIGRLIGNAPEDRLRKWLDSHLQTIAAR